MKITRSQLKRIIKEEMQRTLLTKATGSVSINESSSSLSLDDLMKNVQTNISQALADDEMAPDWETSDLKDYVFKINLEEEEFPYTIHALKDGGIAQLPSDLDDEQKEFVESNFKEEKEKEEYDAALKAEAEKYTSKPLVISVKPPQYTSGEIDFDSDPS